MAPLSTEAKREYDRLRYQANKETRKAQIIARKEAQRAKVNAIKKESGCSSCGCKENLHFHHTDKTTKEFNIADRPGISWERIKNEIDKCIVLCDTCHAAHHHNEDSLLGSNGARGC